MQLISSHSLKSKFPGFVCAEIRQTEILVFSFLNLPSGGKKPLWRKILSAAATPEAGWLLLPHSLFFSLCSARRNIAAEAQKLSIFTSKYQLNG